MGVSAARPGLFFLSDQLESPPQLGYQIHVLALIRAVSPLVPTRGFCWMAPSPPPPAGLVPLDPAAAPRGNLARKRYYVARAFEHIDREAAPGSVVWVRNYSTALLALPGLRRRRRAGIRSVYDASCILRLEVQDSSNRLVASLSSFVEECLRPHFDWVRTLNDPMRDDLVRHGVPAERIMVIPVGAEPQAERWRLRDAPRRLLYVGSAKAWQGLPTLIGAMRIFETRSPQIGLSIVGPSAGEMAGLALPGNVQVLGRVPHAEIGRVYLDHDLFVLPRPRSPLTEIVMPMKILEAMAFGMPILATDLEAIRWTTGSDGAFLVREGGPEALAAAIEAALADPGAMATTGARALERFARFSWDEIGRGIARELFTGSESRPASITRPALNPAGPDGPARRA
jgi:glycosyltransferase involved in cell wall biosynthesis